MIRKWIEIDWVIFLVAAGLLTLGLLILNSIALDAFHQQIFFAFVGLIVYFAVSRVDYQNYDRFSWGFYFVSILLLSLTILAGSSARGTVRWLQVGSISIQTSEITKVFLIIFFASYLAKTRTDGLYELLLAGILLPPAFLIFIQPDLGSCLVVILSWLGIIFAAGLSWRWLTGGIFLMVAVLPLILSLLRDYQKSRLLSFLNPLSDPLNSGYNLVQSVIAIGSGQLFGRGLGRGPQSHLRFLPERHTDFIFASYSEELGFLGSALLLVLFFILGWRLLSLAQRTEDPFGYLLIMGVSTMIFSQIFINIGMNLGMLPITGITLPLISAGGSSLITVMASLGIISNIARQKK